jgi:hypothetical protein
LRGGVEAAVVVDVPVARIADDTCWWVEQTSAPVRAGSAKVVRMPRKRCIIFFNLSYHARRRGESAVQESVDFFDDERLSTHVNIKKNTDDVDGFGEAQSDHLLSRKVVFDEKMAIKKS